tara:strand:- start:1074 stop:1502 length:429 start_codon:yes stop_codon:yes gene_type:complete
MTLIRWASRPSIINDIDYIFNNIKSDYFSKIQNKVWTPNFEVLDIDDLYILRADLPGLTKKDINIEVSDNIVTISGERNDINNNESEYRYSEFSYGTFSKSFTLPDDAIAEKIEAKMKDGVLTLSVSRMKAVKPKVKKISIK